MRIDVTLCLPRDAETVALVRAVTMAALGTLGVTADCVDDIRLALSEACTNVIEHADTGDEYEVHLQVEDSECSIRVIDAGENLDARTLRTEMPDVTARRGRGLALIAALTDSVRFENRPEAGTIVHLVKELELEPEGPLARLRRRV